jgi:hypothetical protein
MVQVMLSPLKTTRTPHVETAGSRLVTTCDMHDLQLHKKFYGQRDRQREGEGHVLYYYICKTGISVRNMEELTLSSDRLLEKPIIPQLVKISQPFNHETWGLIIALVRDRQCTLPGAR